MKKFILTIEMEVSENWVEDGFNPLSKETKESIENVLSDNLLTYSYPNEFKVKIKKAEEKN